MSEEKLFKLNKKEICITSTQIKQAIDLLVNENEILRDKLNKQKEVLDKIKEYCNEVIKEHNNGEYNVSTTQLAIQEHKGNIENILELLEEIE